MNIERAPRGGEPAVAPSAASRGAGPLFGIVAAVFWIVILAFLWVAYGGAGVDAVLPPPQRLLGALNRALDSPLTVRVVLETVTTLAAGGAGALIGFAAGGMVAVITGGNRFFGALFAVLARLPFVLLAPWAILEAGLQPPGMARSAGVVGLLAFGLAGYKRAADPGAAAEAWQSGVMNLFAFVVALEFLGGRTGVGAAAMTAMAKFDTPEFVLWSLIGATLLALALLPGALARRA